MADRPGKQDRKAALATWKAQQRAAAARAKLPVPADRIQAMFDMPDTDLPRRGCDHTLRLVGEWCDRQGITVEPVDAWLLDNGGGCDCEALANAEQAFRDAVCEPGG